jgi:predicted outer membrane repeat protein
LQQAIDGAQSGDTLTLCAGTWTLSSAVVINKSLILIGAGDEATILDGDNATRVLQIPYPVTPVTLQDLTVTRGINGSGNGGGIYNEVSALNLYGVRVTDSTASSGGGGIYNDGGDLTLRAGSRVTGNFSGSDGGGIYNHIGGTTLEAGSLVSGNTAGGSGGGIYSNEHSILQLRAGSRVSGNTAATVGGGIHQFSEDGEAAYIDAGAIICGNSTPQCGGPFYGTCPYPSDGICPPE